MMKEMTVTMEEMAAETRVRIPLLNANLRMLIVAFPDILNG